MECTSHISAGIQSIITDCQKAVSRRERGVIIRGHDCYAPYTSNPDVVSVAISAAHGRLTTAYRAHVRIKFTVALPDESSEGRSGLTARG